MANLASISMNWTKIYTCFQFFSTLLNPWSYMFFSRRKFPQLHSLYCRGRMVTATANSLSRATSFPLCTSSSPVTAAASSTHSLIVCYYLHRFFLLRLTHCFVSYRLFFLRSIAQFIHTFTWIVFSVHKLNKLGKFW